MLHEEDMTGGILKYGETVVITTENVINEELLLMTDDKFSDEGKFPDEE